MKKIIFFMFAAVLCALPLLSSCSQVELIMATSTGFPPYDIEENGVFSGIDIEIARLIADELDMKLVIKDMAFDDVLKAVHKSEADIGMAAITINADRLTLTDFSIPYAEGRQIIVTGNDNTDITGTDGLSGKRVGVMAGTTGEAYCDESVDAASVDSYKTADELSNALIAGEIDAVVIDNAPALHMISHSNGKLRAAQTPFADEKYAIAVNKGDTGLMNGINDAIEKFEQSGEIAEIIDKYIDNE